MDLTSLFSTSLSPALCISPGLSALVFFFFLSFSFAGFVHLTSLFSTSLSPTLCICPGLSAAISRSIFLEDRPLNLMDIFFFFSAFLLSSASVLFSDDFVTDFLWCDFFGEPSSWLPEECLCLWWWWWWRWWWWWCFLCFVESSVWGRCNFKTIGSFSADSLPELLRSFSDFFSFLLTFSSFPRLFLPANPFLLSFTPLVLTSVEVPAPSAICLAMSLNENASLFESILSRFIVASLLTDGLWFSDKSLSRFFLFDVFALASLGVSTGSL